MSNSSSRRLRVLPVSVSSDSPATGRGGADPVRIERVRAARKRIASGYYERGTVKLSLARAVLAALRED